MQELKGFSMEENYLQSEWLVVFATIYRSPSTSGCLLCRHRQVREIAKLFQKTYRTSCRTKNLFPISKGIFNPQWLDIAWWTVIFLLKPPLRSTQKLIFDYKASERAQNQFDPSDGAMEGKGDISLFVTKQRRNLMENFFSQKNVKSLTKEISLIW